MCSVLNIDISWWNKGRGGRWPERMEENQQIVIITAEEATV